MSRKNFFFVLAGIALFSLVMNNSSFGVEKKTENSVQSVTHNPLLPTVAIFTTGGTIAEKYNPKKGGAVPALTGNALIEAVPQLGKIANIKVTQVCNIDSSQMTPEIWAKLSRMVDEGLKDPKINGAVITHGTDTMAEGSFFLDLTLKTNKPVAFVGAMRDASDPSPDGPANILDAVIQVCSPNAQNWGVTLTMNQYIQSARDVQKTNTTNVQTFESPGKGNLGYIVLDKVIRINDRLRRQRLPLPEKLPRIDIVSDYAGSDGSHVRFAVKDGAKGIVVEAVGAGNVNAKMYKAIQYALEKGVPVVITTWVWSGAVLPIYADKGGGATLQKAGCILGGNLPTQKARLMLMLALPVVGKNHHKLNEYFWPDIEFSSKE